VFLSFYFLLWSLRWRSVDFFLHYAKQTNKKIFITNFNNLLKLLLLYFESSTTLFPILAKFERTRGSIFAKRFILNGALGLVFNRRDAEA